MDDRHSAAGAITIRPDVMDAITRLSQFGEEVSRSFERTGAVAAAPSLARLDELQRASRFGAEISGSIDRVGALAAASALVRSDAAKQLSSAGAAIARSVDGAGHRAIYENIARIGETHQNSIASTLKAWSELGAALQLRSQQWSWALEGVDRGFWRLSNLGRTIHSEAPFSRTVGKLLQNELGDISTPDLSADAEERDEVAVRGGLKPELIAFPRDDYPDVLYSAGFRLYVPPTPVPLAIEGSDANAVFDAHHWRIFQDLEQRLRQFVEQRLSDLVGSNWMKARVPGDVRKRWRERQEADRADGRPIYNEIQYADFMDLADVIMEGKNWRESFKAVFRNREDIAVSFRRLHPVRKALAHSRPLGRADALTLISEATRILRALGVQILH